MRYHVKGRVIRSENAAKPATQACKWVLSYIRRLPRNSTGLDYGCGKLRYTIPLARRIKKVFAVDSHVQVSRLQKIKGRLSTIPQYASQRLPNVVICTVGQANWRATRYDVALVLNVLSAIPVYRVRIDILRTVWGLVRPGGSMLAVTQFWSSYFRRWERSPSAVEHLDGWLVKSRAGDSFYGLIDLKSLERHCRQAGVNIAETGYCRSGESAYLVGRKD